MPIQLKNSLFIHVPKCGGRWVREVLKEACQGKDVGDAIYDSHTTPDFDGPVFAFVREPALFCHSLWFHRSKKKINKFGHKFNWQSYLELENKCKSTDYHTWMENCANLKNGVDNYFSHYLSKYDDLVIGKLENVEDDLIKIIKNLEGKDISKTVQKYKNISIGKGQGNTNLINPDIRKRINAINQRYWK